MDRTLVAASRDDVRRALRRAAEVGPFFAVDTGIEAQPADAAVAALAAAARAPHPRVAASLLTMSVAGRVLSVAVAAALLDGVVLDVRTACWRYDAGVGVRLAFDDPAGWRVPGSSRRPATAAAVASVAATADIAAAVADVVLPAVDAVVLAPARAVVPVSPRTLWGNVASSLAGALQTLSTVVPAAACRAFGDVVLAHPRLAGSGGLTGQGLAFRRRSCCLLHRLPAGGVCGDCVLRRQQ